jgi:hypothetical protein
MTASTSVYATYVETQGCLKALMSRLAAQKELPGTGSERLAILKVGRDAVLLHGHQVRQAAEVVDWQPALET